MAVDEGLDIGDARGGVIVGRIAEFVLMRLANSAASPNHWSLSVADGGHGGHPVRVICIVAQRVAEIGPRHADREEESFGSTSRLFAWRMKFITSV